MCVCFMFFLSYPGKQKDTASVKSDSSDDASLIAVNTFTAALPCEADATRRGHRHSISFLGCVYVYAEGEVEC